MFPAVEYDFVPTTYVIYLIQLIVLLIFLNRLSVKEGDHIHFQWVGADSNPKYLFLFIIINDYVNYLLIFFFKKKVEMQEREGG